MKKGLIWLSLLAASVTGAAHAGDAEIQQSLKTLGVPVCKRYLPTTAYFT